MAPNMPSPAGEGGAGRDMLGGCSHPSNSSRPVAAQSPMLARRRFCQSARAPEDRALSFWKVHERQGGHKYALPSECRCHPEFFLGAVRARALSPARNGGGKVGP